MRPPKPNGRTRSECLAPYQRIPFYLIPRNHDVWNAMSADLFRKHTGHELHYSFDYGTARISRCSTTAVPNRSRPKSSRFSGADLAAHAAQRLKVVISHKPSWAVSVMVNSPEFELHRIAEAVRRAVRHRRSRPRAVYVCAGRHHLYISAERRRQSAFDETV